MVVDVATGTHPNPWLHMSARGTMTPTWVPFPGGWALMPNTRVCTMARAHRYSSLLMPVPTSTPAATMTSQSCTVRASCSPASRKASVPYPRGSEVRHGRQQR